MNSEFTLTLERPSTRSKLHVALPEEFCVQMEAVQTKEDHQELATCIVEWILEEFNGQWIPQDFTQNTGFPTQNGSDTFQGERIPKWLGCPSRSRRINDETVSQRSGQGVIDV